MMKTTPWGMAISLVVMVSAASLTANPFYVAPPAAGGDDGNNGLSWASPKATPNAAVAAAVNHGDEVIVSNGVYALSAALTISKSITLRSFENDYNTVVFDGGGASRQIAINATATNAIIAGITVSNSVTGGVMGGGLAINGALNAVVSNCLFTGNSANRGGGVYMKSGTITDSVITHNTSGDAAGGIHNYNAVDTCRIIRCVIANNGPSWGIGVDRNNGHTTIITGCTFSNSASFGLFVGSYSIPADAIVTDCAFVANSNTALNVKSGATAYITNCTFTGNVSASVPGINMAGVGTISESTFTSNRAGGSSPGAVAISGPNVLVDRSTFLHNKGFRGGAVGANSVGGSTLRNCLFAGNGGTEGGAIYADYSNRIENCTLVGNSGGSSGAIYFRGQGSPSVVTIVNTVIYSNTPANFTKYTPAGTYTFDYTGVSPTGTVGYVWGDGNIISNPLFTDAGSNFGTNYVLGDLTLQKTSPVKDRGTNLTWITAGATDLAGNPRLAFSIVDMGAYEYPQGQSGSMFLFR